MMYVLNALYVLLVLIASPYLLYQALRYGKYREGWPAKFLGRVADRESAAPCVWCHAVSVGEVNLLATILDRLQAERPDVEIVISTTTKAGFKLARERYAERATVSYCPLDFSWAMKEAFRRLRPNLLVLVELELWPNFLREARRRQVPVAVVNGRLSERSARGYGRLSSWLPGWLEGITLVAAQSATSARRFVQIGVSAERVCAVGSLKFDGACTDRADPRVRGLAQLAGLETASRPTVFLAGSTQSPEEKLALEAYCTLREEYPDLKLILVPRHIHRCPEVARLLDEAGVSWCYRSSLPDSREASVVLVDTIGELGAWWGCADIGYVGGSMGKRGGQNMLEPAGYGVATSFGPKTRNFRDVVEILRAAQAAVVVRDGQELTDFVRRCLGDPQWATELGDRALGVVSAQQGAALATVERLLHELPQPLPTQAAARRHA